MPETRKPAQPPRSRVVDDFIKAERLTQIAFILPSAVLVGWLLGLGLDKWLHQNWIYLAGIILGCIAGFVQIFRLVLGPEKAAQKPGKAGR